MDAAISAREDTCIPKRLRPTFGLVLEGARNRAIAARLSLAPHTVENYVSELLELFECESRAELIVMVTQSRQGRPQ